MIVIVVTFKCAMSLLEKDASAAEAVAQSAECNSKADGSGVLKEKEKRVVTLTAKAFEQKLERLQNDRKAKLNKASKLREKNQRACANR